MRKSLLLSIFALCATSAWSAEPARCDATAFTLKKPAPPVSEAKKPEAAAKPAAAPAPAKIAKRKTTTRLISDCKDGKKRS